MAKISKIIPEPPKRGGRRPGAGRKPTGATPTINVVVPVEDREAWDAAAVAAGISRSEWIRGACNDAAQAKATKKRRA